MNIIEKSAENLTMAQVYSLTRSPKTRKMSEAVGVVLTPAAWMVYKDANNDGKEVKILSIETTDGEVFATNSETFMREFEYIVNMCADYSAMVNIEVVGGTSKNGRPFITCAYIEI